MGFLDKAKAAATDLAAKADTALASAGMGGPGGHASPEKLLRDLGVVAYLEASGRAAPEGEKDRLMGSLRDLESTNALPPLVLQTTPPSPGAVPPDPGTSPPPPGGAPGMSAGSPPPAPAPRPTAPPPPPPSWMKHDEES